MESAKDNGPVDLVIQTRIADGGAAQYAAWQTKVGEVLHGVPGFVSQQIVMPTPPGQVDWIVVQTFTNIGAARDWLKSDRLANLLAEVTPLFVGKDDIFLRPRNDAVKDPVTAIVTCNVDPDHEQEFLDWQRQVFQAESRFPGFMGHRLERPVPGIQDKWVIVLSFDTSENLTKWLESPDRMKLLAQGEGFQTDIQVRKSTYGFEFWFRSGDTPKPSPIWIFKTNLIVLLMLYPIVYLWGFFAGDPVVTRLGAPFWLALFIGNIFSTQLLGWGVVSWAFARFSKWLDPKVSRSGDILGYVVLILLYGLSMALFAYLLSIPKLQYF